MLSSKSRHFLRSDNRQNSDYFLDTLGNEVRDIRRNMDELGCNLETIDAEVSSTYAEVNEVVTCHERLTREQQNVGELLNILETCRTITKNMQCVREYMEKKKNSFAATNLLNAIRKDCKNGNFLTSFIPRVDEWCVYMSRRIMNDSKEDLFLYYEVVNAKTTCIGDYLLYSMANQCIEMEHTISSSSIHAHIQVQGDKLDRRLSMSLSHLIQNCGVIFRWKEWATNEELMKSIPVYYTKEEQTVNDSVIKSLMKDLGSLNVSVHLFASFDCQSQFREFYRMTRGAMLSRVIWDILHQGKPLTNIEIDQLVAEKGLPFVLTNVIANIVGFFFIECTAKQLCEFDVLFTTSQLYDIFESACVEIDGLIKRHYGSIRNIDVCLQIKELLVLLSETMLDDTFIGGIRANKLSDTLQYMWDEFVLILRKLMKQNTLRALKIGMYQPYFVSNQTQCDNQ